MDPRRTDFGLSAKAARAGRINWPVFIGAVATGVLATAAWAVWDQSRQIAEATAAAKVSEISGPPCPAAPGGRFKTPLPLTQFLDFNGARFGRRFGAADCSAIAKKSLFSAGYNLACQFSSPWVLSVRTDKGVFYYEPGSGQEATIFVVDGTPRCVMASPYFRRWKQAITETDDQGRPTYSVPTR
jgi:hypothetical protein